MKRAALSHLLAPKMFRFKETLLAGWVKAETPRNPNTVSRVEREHTVLQLATPGSKSSYSGASGVPAGLRLLMGGSGLQNQSTKCQVPVIGGACVWGRTASGAVQKG